MDSALQALTLYSGLFPEVFAYNKSKNEDSSTNEFSRDLKYYIYKQIPFFGDTNEIILVSDQDAKRKLKEILTLSGILYGGFFSVNQKQILIKLGDLIISNENWQCILLNEENSYFYLFQVTLRKEVSEKLWKNVCDHSKNIKSPYIGRAIQNYILATNTENPVTERQSEQLIKYNSNNFYYETAQVDNIEDESGNNKIVYSDFAFYTTNDQNIFKHVKVTSNDIVFSSYQFYFLLDKDANIKNPEIQYAGKAPTLASKRTKAIEKLLGNKVISFCLFKFGNSLLFGDYCYLDIICSKKGYGSVLMSKVINECLRKNVYKIVLSVNKGKTTEDERAIYFYMSIGFKPIMHKYEYATQEKSKPPPDDEQAEFLKTVTNSTDIENLNSNQHVFLKSYLMLLDLSKSNPELLNKLNSVIQEENSSYVNSLFF